MAASIVYRGRGRKIKFCWFISTMGTKFSAKPFIFFENKHSSICRIFLSAGNVGGKKS
jgi:hypothetical protein